MDIVRSDQTTAGEEAASVLSIDEVLKILSLIRRELLGSGRTKTSAEPSQEQQDQKEEPEPRLCPQCGGELLFVRRLSPLGR